MSVIIIFFLNRFLVYIGEWKRWDWIYISPRHIFIVHDVFLIRFKFGWDLSWYPANTSRSCISNERRICHWNKTLIWKGMFQYDNGRRSIFRLSLNICVRKRKCFWWGIFFVDMEILSSYFNQLRRYFHIYSSRIICPSQHLLTRIYAVKQDETYYFVDYLSVCPKKSDWTDTTNKLALLIHQLPTYFLLGPRTDSTSYKKKKRVDKICIIVRID